MIRLLLIDRVRLVCDVIGAALHGEPDIQVIGTATTEEDGMRILGESQCDIVLVGTSLPNDGALSLVETVREEELDVKVLVMGVPDTEPVIMAYLNAGAFGYVLRDDPVQQLLANIRAAHEDKALVTPAVAARLISRIAELSQKLAELGVETADFEELTPREREILELIGQGLANQEIADQLVIELGTVKNHVHSILDKLNVNSRKDAALYLTLINESSGISEMGSEDQEASNRSEGAGGEDSPAAS